MERLAAKDIIEIHDHKKLVNLISTLLISETVSARVSISAYVTV